MAQRPKLYLAGPDVFLPNAVEMGHRKKELCESFGFEGLFPLDNEMVTGFSEERRDAFIYRANVAMIRDADAAIVNLTPFRGISADVGTAFELGLLTGLNRPVFAYTNDSENLLDRTKRSGMANFDASTSSWRDPHGLLIEDFGNADNLMLTEALTVQGGVLIRIDAQGRLDDLSGFTACLEEARKYFEA
jgi:nucleoside 2-deoxyribosyltransferase